MPPIEVGRICVKISGRESGKKCIILDVIDKNFVLITGPKQLTGVRRRKANVKHLEATEEKIKIKKGATDEEVMKALEKSQKLDYVKLEVKPKIS
ncbi:MAG: 50S ribosomal protein L14e [Candidatus Bathyarchaeia archaeon]